MVQGQVFLKGGEGEGGLVKGWVPYKTGEYALGVKKLSKNCIGVFRIQSKI